MQRFDLQQKCTFLVSTCDNHTDEGIFKIGALRLTNSEYHGLGIGITEMLSIYKRTIAFERCENIVD